MKTVFKITIAILLILSVLVLASCTEDFASGGDFYSFTDSLGREVGLDEPPRHVAVLFSSYAEIWQIAGGVTAITVADTVERGFADESAIIVDGGAGHTSINTEILLAAMPDFVIATANYPIQVEICELLASQGIPTALFSVEKFEDYLGVLKIFTDILGTEEKYIEYGVSVKNRIDGYLDTVSSYLSENPDKKSDMLFIRAGSTPRSTKAKRADDHFACAMLEELGLYNIADAAPVLLDGLSLEEIVMANPEHLFVSMMGENEEAVKKNVGEILSREGYSTLDAVVEGRVEFLPKELFHYKPNHRWADAYLYLIEILFSEVEI